MVVVHESTPTGSLAARAGVSHAAQTALAMQTANPMPKSLTTGPVRCGSSFVQPEGECNTFARWRDIVSASRRLQPSYELDPVGGNSQRVGAKRRPMTGSVYCADLDANPERFVSNVCKGKFAAFVDDSNGKPTDAE
jgi:hypothetical protein